jgi:hypothetical protein
MTLNLAEASHDIYVIGTQESALSEKEWSAIIRRHLGDNFTLVCSNALVAFFITLCRHSFLTHRLLLNSSGRSAL